MFFLSHEECEAYCTNEGWDVEVTRRYPVLPPSGFEAISFMVPPQRERLTVFCRLLVDDIIRLGDIDECLVWMMHWRDWGNSANYHLYYRLRQSYSDFRQIYQAPGHVFMGHETSDLLTFVELALLFGWDFQVLREHEGWGAYHDDELFIIYTNEASMMEGAKAALTRFGIEWRKHD